MNDMSEETDDGLTMTALAQCFPCVRGVLGVSPWDAEEFDRWAAGPTSHGEKVTARFLLAVWDSSVARKSAAWTSWRL